ncbi:DUF6893 family small protein [Pseudarthrobacter sp. P1]
MRTLGKISAVGLLVVALAGVVVALRSIPDIARYLRISRM